MPDTACPFCGPNWPSLDIVECAMPVGPVGSVAIIRPLNPVTDGHVLVIHREHDTSAAASFEASRRACLLMAVAADYVNAQGLQANIITSIGPDATQTVFHTHLHVVPRRADDGLALPWTESEELTNYRRKHYRDHMWSHAMDNLRYAEREEYSCGYDGQPGAPGGPHTYDADELAAAMTCDDPIHQCAKQFENDDA